MGMVLLPRGETYALLAGRALPLAAPLIQKSDITPFAAKQTGGDPKYGDFTETDADLSEKYAPGEKARIEAIRERQRREGSPWNHNLGPGIVDVSPEPLADRRRAVQRSVVPIWSGDGSMLIGYEPLPERVMVKA